MIAPDRSVRVAHDADIPALVAVINAAYLVEAFFKRGDRTDARELRQLMETGRFLVLDGPDELQGCVYVEVNRDKGYLGMLSIDPSRQHQGLGARLIQAAEDACRSAGCTSMELQVVSLRTELPPYYRKFGYVDVGIREFAQTGEWMQPCHFIVMGKAL